MVATRNFSFNPYRYYYNVSFSCKITEPIEEGDCLYLVSKAGNEDYKIVEGGPNVADVINLTAGAKVNTYQVTWNSLSGVTLTSEKGYNADAVTEGDDFKFKLRIQPQIQLLLKMAIQNSNQMLKAYIHYRISGKIFI